MLNDYSDTAILQIRDAIEQASGNEVFFLGTTDMEKQVLSVEVLARGSDNAVPAILQACSHGDVVIHNHPSGRLEPSGADIEVASRLGGLGVGFHIVDNSVENVYKVVEIFPPQEQKSLDPKEIEKILGPHGSVAASLKGYEERAEQLQMALEIGAAFNHDRVAIIEAGTGTGKSLAYLVPAILFSRSNEQRVIISTKTINLQEQLIRKDIPYLQRNCGIDFRAVLVKGRSNYLCKRRLKNALAEPGLFDTMQSSELGNIESWATATADGSREELPQPPADEVWEEVRCEVDQCARARCEFYADCFFYRARRQAASADILVVNHALLLSDLALRRVTDNYSAAAVLPPCDRLILDEAHHLEDVATSYFSARVTRFAFARILNRLRHPRKSDKGLLPRLFTQLGTKLPDSCDDLYRALHTRIEEILAARAELYDRAISTLENIGSGLAASLDIDIPENEELRHRIVPTFRASATWQDMAGEVEELAGKTGAIAKGIRALLKQCEQIPEKYYDAFVSNLTDLAGLGRRLEGLATDLGLFSAEDENYCSWIEVREGRIGRGRGIVTRLCSSPLSVDMLLRETIFERNKSVILTSATLAVNNRFTYLKQRTGLNDIETQRLLELELASPFDFRKQALLVVPSDNPAPGQNGYPEMLREQIEQAILAAGGRTFVLFTAYSMLRRIHAELAPILEPQGFRCLRQGEMNRHKLLKAFSSDPSSILFATDSFWEGVDVPGRSLEQVIIARLPFRVPSEPVLEARAEAIERAGGDPFMEYTVPQAVIRFKQGFGRLIRNRTDRGVVLILDNRVIKRGYGRMFLNSLPDVPLIAAPTEQTRETIKTFFAG
ncbi:MAG: helicase [Desulfuromonas sp.]|nr:MAG: helicase [Desulfuromonas sp.]